jgi:hypothetical protein
MVAIGVARAIYPPYNDMNPVLNGPTVAFGADF